MCVCVCVCAHALIFNNISKHYISCGIYIPGVNIVDEYSIYGIYSSMGDIL